MSVSQVVRATLYLPSLGYGGILRSKPPLAGASMCDCLTVHHAPTAGAQHASQAKRPDYWT